MEKILTRELKDVIITRTLDADRATVWRTWTDPELVKQWWGPNDYSCPIAKSDFRVGGSYLYSMKTPEGQLTWSGGTFQEISKPNKIVATDSFMDESGNIVSPEIYGMPPYHPTILTLTVTFDDLGDQTRLSLHHSSFPEELIEPCTQGWNESLDKFEAALKLNLS